MRPYPTTSLNHLKKSQEQHPPLARVIRDEMFLMCACYPHLLQRPTIFYVLSPRGAHSTFASSILPFSLSIRIRVPLSSFFLTLFLTAPAPISYLLLSTSPHAASAQTPPCGDVHFCNCPITSHINHPLVETTVLQTRNIIAIVCIVQTSVAHHRSTLPRPPCFPTTRFSESSVGSISHFVGSPSFPSTAAPLLCALFITDDPNPSSVFISRFYQLCMYPPLWPAKGTAPTHPLFHLILLFRYKTRRKCKLKLASNHKLSRDRVGADDLPPVERQSDGVNLRSMHCLPAYACMVSENGQLSCVIPRSSMAFVPVLIWRTSGVTLHLQFALQP